MVVTTTSSISKKKYVLTGGPCSGKTTILKEMEKRNFVCIPESAREIIEAESFKEKGIFPWNDFIGFQKKVFQLQISKENHLSDEMIFLDRSIIDSLAYMLAEGYVINNIVLQELIEHTDIGDYDTVFFLEMLPDYKQDLSRREDREKAIHISETIYDLYLALGYHVIRIPPLSLMNRLDEIFKYVQSDISGNFPEIFRN